MFNATTPCEDPQLGSTHSDDLQYTFGEAWAKGASEGYSDDQITLSTQLMDYWINFAYHLDPNGDCLPEWPAHDFPGNKNSLSIIPGALSVIQDDFREDKMDWMNDSAVAKGLWMRDSESVTAELRRLSA